MDYSLGMIVKKGYLHFQVGGTNSVATTGRYVRDILEASVRERCPNVLIELDLSGPRLSLTEIFEIISVNAGEVGSTLRRIAYVNVNLEELDANSTFAETVAANRGMNARGFGTVEEAEGWLQSKLSEKDYRDGIKGS